MLFRSVCESNYYRATISRDCVSCDTEETATPWFLQPLIILFVLVVLIIISAIEHRDAFRKYHEKHKDWFLTMNNHGIRDPK